MQVDLKPVVAVVEDEPLIGLTIMTELADAGFDAIGPFNSVRRAMEAIQSTRMDAVILDVALVDGQSTSVAGELERRGIPSIIISGYPEAAIPAAFRNTLHLSKPLDYALLVRSLRELVQT